MKKRRPNNYKTIAYFQKLKTIYLIGCWAKYGYRKFYNSGKVDKDGIPLVWDYYDGNGTCDEWHLVPINKTTTGWCVGWTPSEGYAKKVSDALNIMEAGYMYYKGNIAYVNYSAKENKLIGTIQNEKRTVFEENLKEDITEEFHKTVDNLPGIENETPFGVVKKLDPTTSSCT